MTVWDFQFELDFEKALEIFFLVGGETPDSFVGVLS